MAGDGFKARKLILKLSYQPEQAFQPLITVGSLFELDAAFMEALNIVLNFGPDTRDHDRAFAYVMEISTLWHCSLIHLSVEYRWLFGGQCQVAKSRQNAAPSDWGKVSEMETKWDAWASVKFSTEPLLAQASQPPQVPGLSQAAQLSQVPRPSCLAD